MSDITTVPFDYIVKHTKTENIVSIDEHGDYVCDIETEYKPLVMCKECRFWNENTQFCAAFSDTNKARRMLADDFCSLGLRKGADDD